MTLQFLTVGIKTACEHTGNYVGNKSVCFLLKFFKKDTLIKSIFRVISQGYIVDVFRIYLKSKKIFSKICTSRRVQTFDWPCPYSMNYCQLMLRSRSQNSQETANLNLRSKYRTVIPCNGDLRGPKDQIRSTVFLHFFPCSRLSSWALSPLTSSSTLGLTSTFFPSLTDMFSCSRV